MKMSPLVLVLIGLGASWGLTQPLSKIAVSTGYQPFGLIFWQFLVGAIFLGLIQIVRRRPVPLHGRAIFVYVAIAFLGTLMPNFASYVAYRHLPAGVMSIVISLVPLLAFPIALFLGSDRFGWMRLGGLVLGLVGIALIVLPSGASWQVSPFWVGIAMIAPAFYAIEANFVGTYGTDGLGGIQVLFGASAVGALISGPLAVAAGQWVTPAWPPSAPDIALTVSSLLHVLAYATYVWLVGRAGATFAAQGSYVVTGFGVVWAMVLLGERYPASLWFALLLVLGGLALVQPRKGESLAAQALPGDSGPL
jgi:drug/metabolite transporter (DMT)-like permease